MVRACKENTDRSAFCGTCMAEPWWCVLTWCNLWELSCMICGDWQCWGMMLVLVCAYISPPRPAKCRHESCQFPMLSLVFPSQFLVPSLPRCCDCVSSCDLKESLHWLKDKSDMKAQLLPFTTWEWDSGRRWVAGWDPSAGLSTSPFFLQPSRFTVDSVRY